MTIPIYSGRYGNVHKRFWVRDPENPLNPPVAVESAVSAVRNWFASEITSPHQHVHSGTRAGTNRTTGTYDWNGGFETYGVVPEIMPGEYFDFEGFKAPDDQLVSGSGDVVKALIYTADPNHPLYNWPGAIMESVDINFDFNSGELPQISYTFSQANGTRLQVVTEFQIDDTNFVSQPVCPLSLEYKSRNDADSAYERREWALVTSVNITLNCNAQNFINSSTFCGNGRFPGAVDCTIAVAVDSSRTPPIIYPGEASRAMAVDDRVTLYMWTAAKPAVLPPITDGGDFWIFEGMRFTELTDFRVDPETQEPIGYTANFGMSALDDNDGELGFIARPGEMKNNQPTFNLPWWPDIYNQNAYTP